MITPDLKIKIAEAIALNRKNFGSNSKQAIALGIHSSILTRINNGETENLLSDAKWVSIARRLEVQLINAPAWITAKTSVFTHIYTQLEACQQTGLSALLCDLADIGKTHTARQYVLEHKNAVYIDCSQVKSKQKLIREIAKEFGCNYTARYADVYADLVFYLRSIETPLIVIDEAGDLDYPAFLELKALWNATEWACAWYMMGADGLREKIERNKDLKKVGYTEIFSRFGNKYQQVVPHGKEARNDFLLRQVGLVALANGIHDVQKIYAKCGNSLRQVFKEVQKLKVA
ncbi:ATP-binding protein [Pedobacter sp. ASV28]|jgi:AAA domain|uniref:ATP-binding protein n=1 Tax=Pedobacter sp. ASV28 TaxID=2795123 RepID=UPI0018EC8D80|nr:ATP-binding protein [Pedobacter sp. ASV28]